MRVPGGFRVFREADGVAELLGATVVAFGKFDGVHRGHRALLDRALAAGRRMSLATGAVTFERHPHAHLRDGRVPPALTGLADRLRLLRDAGAAFVVLLPTDATVLGLAAEDFAREVLRDRMAVRLVVVGENFRFGRGGAGDIGTLRRLVSVTGLDGVELGMVSVAVSWCRRPGSASTWPAATSTGPGTCSAGRTTSSDAWPTPRRRASSGYPRHGRSPRPGATGRRSGRSGRGDAERPRSSGSTGPRKDSIRGDPTAGRRCTERDCLPRCSRGVRGQGLMRVLWINAAAEPG